MKFKWPMWFLAAASLLITGSTPLAQPSPDNSLYTLWIRLSLSGMNQSEIQSLLEKLDRKSIPDVKDKLRQTVLSNLKAKRVRERFLASRDSDDLNSVLISIETELRFAGLQNDEEVIRMIKERLGITMGRF